MRRYELLTDAVRFAGMRCEHPIEELQAVFKGGRTPLPGRKLCGLCGEMRYTAPETDTGKEWPMPSSAQVRVRGPIAGRETSLPDGPWKR